MTDLTTEDVKRVFLTNAARQMPGNTGYLIVKSNQFDEWLQEQREFWMSEGARYALPSAE